ncbi:hypothetical protein MRB53_005352 [Persea americana]|uniref:Uncharacterized protein n=1 Tax=Persea americana TaxID=3435 RepID=A0ACC2ME42_PERAE|nr:hypothetical protein MRB53_005352 [Persea americana]
MISESVYRSRETVGIGVLCYGFVRLDSVHGVDPANAAACLLRTGLYEWRKSAVSVFNFVALAQAVALFCYFVVFAIGIVFKFYSF